ncbi:hypothetical protein E4T50_01022 [Aureobasidium sp. EXF-12298]|nr:hypothetical protein E4T50_01022 [Aureobasidium sp. EXF-12298]
MIVARQEPPQVAHSSYFASINSYYASRYSAEQASQTATRTDDDDDQQFSSSGNDDKTESDFSTAIALAFGSTTATLENSATTTKSISYETAQSQTSERVTSSDSVVQSTTTPSMTTSFSWTQPAWRPGWHSYAPSYISTATSSGTSAATLSPSLDIQEKAHHGPSATIIAGVVIPIVILLASGLVAMACLRRRRKRAAISGAGHTTVVGAVAPVAMAEKVAEKKPMSSVHHTTHTTTLSPIDEATAAPQLPQLVITSSQNASYFTGLDTFSVHSAATTEDPPPPYRARSMLSHTSSERRQPSIVQTAALAPVSPISPVSPVAHLTSPFSDANAISVTRSPSQRSFASTLYSSNASVYEARPARRSTGPAEYVISPRSSMEEPTRVRSPFDDPEDEVVNVRRDES